MGLSGVNIVSSFLLLVFVELGAVVNCQQEDIGCFVPLACTESTVVGFATLETPSECLEYCQSINSTCRYFTHFAEDDVCVASSNCVTQNSDCTDCISGDVGCSSVSLECHLNGECIDIGIGYEINASQESCINACKDEPACLWWTYNPGTDVCFLFAGCAEIESETCPGCISGQKDCPSLQCDQPGVCASSMLGNFAASSQDSCINICKDMATCEWWTYYANAGSCMLFSACSEINDETCPHCVTGQKTCPSDEPSTGKNILLVIGGMTSDGPTPEVEAIHLGGEGMVCDAPASLPYPNSKMSAAEINGDPVVCGGDDFSGQMCFMLHAEDGDGADPAWGPIASMRMARYGHASAQMTSDTFWMTGGGEYPSTTSIEEYQGTAADTFVPVSTPQGPFEFANHCAVRKPDAPRIYLNGGSMFFSYDFDNEEWFEEPASLNPRSGHMCGVTRSQMTGTWDQLMVAGGSYQTNNETTDSTEVFTLASGNWESGPSLPFEVSHGVAVPFKDSFLIVGGLLGPSGLPSSAILEYDADKAEWVERPEQLSTARSQLAAVMVSEEQLKCVRKS